MKYTILLFALLLPFMVMADTQTKFVGTVTSATPGTTDWNNISNLTADNNTGGDLSAKIKGGSTTYHITATMNGNVFTIPSGATINGITVNVDVIDDLKDGPCGDSTILIIKGGTASGTDHKVVTDDWPTTAGIKSWGSTSDLWGLSWTNTDINATNFGIEIFLVEVDNVFTQLDLDYIQISIDYTPSGGDPDLWGGAVIIVN